MIWLYLAFAIFGGAFVIPMALGGLDADVDIGGDLDVGGDLDIGADLDVGELSADVGDFGADTDGLLSGVGDFVSALISFRSLVFFAAFFGFAGLVFSWFDFAEPAPLLTAGALGFTAAALNTQLFRFLKSSESSSQVTDRELHGQQASVVVPLGPGRKGRIRADVNGQPHYLVALPFRSGDDEHYGVGEPVLVIEIEDGTAMVAPLPSLETGGE